MSGRPRSPGFAFAALSLALIVLLAVIAMSTRQPPPPTIAEFAPQAVEQIIDSDPNQAAGAGGGSVGASAVMADDAALPTPPAIRVPRVRKCIGDPPRQIEDPQSPPCVPYWSGDNGGSTTRGVTRDEVRVAVASSYYGEDIQLMVAFFNARFELYGRSIRLLPFDCSDNEGPATMQANAVTVDEQLQAFAALGHCDATGNEFHFYDELARRRIVSVNNLPTMMDESHLRRFHPYIWSVIPGEDVQSVNKAHWICSSLNGRPAAYAGGREQGRPRVFGILNQLNDDGTFADLAPMRAVLAACGARVAEDTDTGDINAIVKLQTAGVTTVIHENADYTVSPARATSQGYFPEWLVGTYLYQDHDLAPSLWPREQGIHAFGLTWWNKQVALESSPFSWAIKEADPGYGYDGPTGAAYAWGAFRTYSGVLLLASGLQMAGPRLSAATFGSGLQRTSFPNPGAGADPYFQAHVGFSGDHTMFNDSALIWNSAQDRSAWGSTPSYCYARRGVRFAEGRLGWPRDDADLFRRPCT